MQTKKKTMNKQCTLIGKFVSHKVWIKNSKTALHINWGLNI